MHKNAHIHKAVPAENGAMTEKKLCFVSFTRFIYFYLFPSSKILTVHLYITQVNAQYIDHDKICVIFLVFNLSILFCDEFLSLNSAFANSTI